MYAIMLSVVRYLLGYVLQTVVLKFLAFTTAYIVISELVPVIIDKVLPAAFNTGDKDGGMAQVIRMIPDDIWYFLGVLQMRVGLPVVVAAILARFVIRRLHLVR